MENKAVSKLWFFAKIMVFFGFIYTSWIMFRLKNSYTGTILLFALSFFMIFNKIDNQDKRIKALEGVKDAKM